MRQSDFRAWLMTSDIGVQIKRESDFHSWLKGNITMRVTETDFYEWLLNATLNDRITLSIGTVDPMVEDPLPFATAAYLRGEIEMFTTKISSDGRYSVFQKIAVRIDQEVKQKLDTRHFCASDRAEVDQLVRDGVGV